MENYLIFFTGNNPSYRNKNDVSFQYHSAMRFWINLQIVLTKKRSLGLRLEENIMRVQFQTVVVENVIL